MKKATVFMALALALTLGIASVAFAQHNGGGGHGDHGHRDNTNNAAAQQPSSPSFYQHGGAHEQAKDSNAAHEAEMKKDPNHMDNSAQ